MLPRMTKKSSQVMSKGFILEQNEFFLAQDQGSSSTRGGCSRSRRRAEVPETHCFHFSDHLFLGFGVSCITLLGSSHIPRVAVCPLLCEQQSPGPRCPAEEGATLMSPSFCSYLSSGKAFPSSSPSDVSQGSCCLQRRDPSCFPPVSALINPSSSQRLL